MFKKIATPLYLLIFTLFAAQLQAATLIPSPPQINARAYIVMDADTGKVITSHDADKRFPPASLTKMMTAYILEYELSKGNVSEDDLVLVSEKAWRTQGSRMFIKEGTQVKLGDLMRGIVIQSGNDASVAVAEHIAGSESAFADLMNQHAQLLGMENTQFRNATGLPADDHYSSAVDLAKLAQAIIERFPEHYDMYSQKYFTYNKIRQPNRNKLLWRDKTVDGLKTGFTDAAGYCLVASAERDGMRLISVVLGTKNENARAQESQKLLAYGFRYFRTHKLYDAEQVLNQAQVWGAEKDQVALGLAEPLSVTIPRGQADQLDASMDIDKVIEGPIVKGSEYGMARVTLNGELVAELPLIALEDIPQAGLLKRIWHAVLMFFFSLIG
ncbi:D-alanyl-D-alanine carboxypeptidase family protein [Marinobacterium arenosum]|uniref:D-alanyl-D-alanine carboxypeptidase family protein n=1 Tax=Marinobacterium arenosum TaxID=2862496 RepID=UPI001C972282|nr:D-alanyl-D-alanine carboxypeptidase family protein [Marinobacterium arenosum]MBY4676211.1 D-alanyl-D-alanine carboxypeptidase [Marinobacterium arenosum]